MSVLTLTEVGSRSAAVFMQHSVAKASVFGSFARNQQKDDSDVDFLVGFLPGIKVNIMDMVHLQSDLSDVLERDVDVNDIHHFNATARPSLFLSVMASIVPIFDHRFLHDQQSFLWQL